VCCGAALAASAVVVATNDPSTAGSRFPACAFHAATGLWCPGCGLTRGTHRLLNGDIPAALGMNVFTPLVLVAIVAAWWRWTRTSWGAPPRPIRAFSPNASWTMWLAAVLVAYGVLRNMPIDALRWLAPA
jgi:hypothetical protein